MDRIGFGVIGCGTAAWTGHLPWIWSHPEAKLVAVCDANGERAAQARERYQGCLATTDYREVLYRSDVHAVCICTPPTSHLEIATTAAAHGKHVLIEKPMGRNVDECER